MDYPRMDAYQPFGLEVLRLQGQKLLFCWLIALPCLLFVPGMKLRAAGAVFAMFLVALAVLDGCYGLLYDRLLMPMAVLGLALELWGCLPCGIEDALSAALLAGGFFCLLRFFSRGGLGWGDVKYVAVLGLWLGGRGTVAAVSLAITLGGLLAVALLMRGWSRNRALPFGPFLSLGAYLAYIWGESLWQFYWGLLT